MEMSVRALENECDANDRITEPGRTRASVRVGADLDRAWNALGVMSATRKRITHTLIEEIVVRFENDALSCPACSSCRRG
jgi:hypothetical protein